MKSEPDVYSIDDLARQGRSRWEGVRNFRARNFMREMRIGDQVLFYHSSADPSGVVGIATLVVEAYPDPFQFDEKSDYFDPKSTKERPRWSAVDVEFVEKFPSVFSLLALKNDAALKDMLVVRKGQRLSVQPVDKKHFDHVVRRARAP